MIVYDESLGTGASLSADQTWTGAQTFRAAVIERSSTDGALIAKPLGDGKGGVKDLTNDDTVGFIYHLHTGPNSGASTAAWAVGTDDGAGSGGLISHKNAGIGLRVVHNPTATGDGMRITAYGKSAFPFRFDSFVGNQGFIFATMPGEGFNNGQILAANLNRLIVPGANFTGADVGLSVSQTTSTGRTLTGPNGAPAITDSIVIPANTTISSIVDTDTVVMSSPATGPVNGTNIFIGRPVVSGQNFMRFFDNATEVGTVTRSQFRWRLPFEVTAGAGSNSNSIFQDGTAMRFYIYNGTNYTRSDVFADVGGGKLRAYGAAAKGSESAPNTIISWASGSGGKLAFFGGTEQAKQVVTGSRSGNAALASALTALAAYGFITDSTTA